jgi:hypothetical protein
MSAARVSYQIIGWSAVVWIAICVAPYVYALNDLTTYIRFRSISFAQAIEYLPWVRSGR